MTDNINLRISFNYKYPDEAVLAVYSAFGGGYLGGDPTINVREVIIGEKAVEIYSKLTGVTVNDVKKGAGYPKED